MKIANEHQFGSNSAESQISIHARAKGPAIKDGFIDFLSTIKASNDSVSNVYRSTLKAEIQQ